MAEPMSDEQPAETRHRAACSGACGLDDACECLPHALVCGWCNDPWPCEYVRGGTENTGDSAREDEQRIEELLAMPPALLQPEAIELRSEVKRLRKELETARDKVELWHGTADDIYADLIRWRAEYRRLEADRGHLADQVERLREEVNAAEKTAAERSDQAREHKDRLDKTTRWAAAIQGDLAAARAQLEAFVPPGALSAGETPALCGTCKELACVPGLPGCARCVKAELDRLTARDEQDGGGRG